MPKEHTGPTKAELREQCERLGIVLSVRCGVDDYSAALDAYARGYTAGCDKAYHQGVEAGKTMSAEKDWAPKNWPDAVARLGHRVARVRYPAMYSEFAAAQRQEARRRG